jgi:hypothetical protein
MKKGFKNPHTLEWNRKISEGVKRQHAEGRGRSPGFTREALEKAWSKNWKGEKVSYVGLHAWIRRKKGTPRKCELCGTIKAKKYEWANIDHKYKRDVNDYFRCCTSCHRTYDMEKNGYKIPNRILI